LRADGRGGARDVVRSHVLGVVRSDVLDGARSWWVVARRVVPLVVVVVAYGAARAAVLGGVGGTGDPAAPPAGKLLQIASGLVHAFGASDVLAPPVGWTVGIGG